MPSLDFIVPERKEFKGRCSCLVENTRVKKLVLAAVCKNRKYSVSRLIDSHKPSRVDVNAFSKDNLHTAH